MKIIIELNKKLIEPTSITGRGEGVVFCACLTTKLLRRISAPEGGPSK